VEIDSFLERSLVNNAFLSESLSAQISIAVSSVGFHSDEATFNRSIPMGRYKLRLQCDSATCVPESYVITILPRQTLAPLEFRIIP
ncbi:MAG: hypothetical protein R3309_15255, partial [Reinekea sp.]|nr:hypothetical protein [Reinekea sp.]